MTKPPPRELQVLQLAADGCGAKLAAVRLGLRVSTVKHYRYRACKRLGTRSITRAVVLAYQRGWIE